MKRYKKNILGISALLLTAAPAYGINYAEALQKSIYFYEAQQSGPLPPWNRVEWRGPAAMMDGAAEGVDLTGGWFDAGDHVKFGFPMAFSATMLAWGVVDYPLAYEQAGQMKHIQNNLRFVADYFVKAHTAPNELWGQVGAGGPDHNWWGPAEVMQMARPAYKIDEKCPGSDLAGETAAALASIAMIFEKTDAAYAQNLLTHAKQLYDFAVKYPGKYSDCITDAKQFYNSWSGYQDELVWSALWLYRATGDKSYLDQAVAGYEHLNTEPQSTTKSYKWTIAWDDKSYGAYVLLAALTNDKKYHEDAQRWLDYWSVGYKGERVRYTPGGLAYLDTWAATRYTANTSFVALVYSDLLRRDNPKSEEGMRYYKFALSQMEYILGKNPKGLSYQIGVGEKYPFNPHHRTAHGSWNDSIQEPAKSRHLLIGALMGGPDSKDEYVDDRGNYVYNEVATDYNAAFTSALARLSLDFPGEPIAEEKFPAKEQRDLEYYVDAKINSQGPRHIEIATNVYNHSAWPAEVATDLHYRYWVDLAEVFKLGYKASDITISTAHSQATRISGLMRWGEEGSTLYYVDVSFAGVKIYPGGQSASRKEVQLRFSLPTNSNKPEWNNSNDPSWDNYTSSAKITRKIALYSGSRKVWGDEPQGGASTPTDPDLPPPPSVKISAPYDGSSFLVGDSFTVSYTFSGAPKARLSFNGSKVDDLEASGSLVVTAPDKAGSYLLKLVAVDKEGKELEAADEITVNVREPSSGALRCTLGKVDSWNSGFVINNIEVMNDSDKALDGWQVVLTFPSPVTITNMWNGVGSLAADGTTLIVRNDTNNGRLAPAGTAMFGFQGSFSGVFGTPSCGGSK
jgi:hypothetical protein